MSGFAPTRAATCRPPAATCAAASNIAITRNGGASETAVRSTILGVVKRVAAELRNTPAVCRKSYINPIVFERWRSGAVHRAFGKCAAEISMRKAEILARRLLGRL